MLDTQMQDTQSESRNHNLHEEWLSRRAYVECFGSREPPAVFKKWRGNPDPCRCGCGEVSYSRSNPENLWKSLSPQVLWKTGFLIPIFRAMYGVLWGVIGAGVGRFSGRIFLGGGQGSRHSGPTGQQTGQGPDAIEVPVLVGFLPRAVPHGGGRMVSA